MQGLECCFDIYLFILGLCWMITSGLIPIFLLHHPHSGLIEPCALLKFYLPDAGLVPLHHPALNPTPFFQSECRSFPKIQAACGTLRV